ncbi:hypothetical protein C8E03_11754 [Lachnotalea glycerini]|uniref:Uncharacterized protein n=1 Tax=Lachnotalea glycerini TaxID=1763509 RepID=A0A318EH21_9FIRM|nr:hypothetical protein [Lachnotalea glycerini]PXV85418.1 hypothetical protein C8E03_11754 [Lachnotalea glycerini]
MNKKVIRIFIALCLVFVMTSSTVFATTKKNSVLKESFDTEILKSNSTILNKETTVELEKEPAELKEEIIADTKESNVPNTKAYNQNTVQPTNIIWSHLWGSEDINILNSQSTADGGYIIASTTTTNNCIWLTKIDSNGNIEWTYVYGEGYNWEVYAVKQTSDSGYVLTGKVNDDVFLIKMDANGNVQWINLYGGDEEDYGNDVVQTIDGGYFIVGTTKSFGSENYEAYLIKTNAKGEGEWGGILPSENSFEFGKQALIEPSTGNIIVRTYGMKNISSINTVLKISNTGTIIQSSYIDKLSSVANDMILTADEELILTGYANSDITILKLDSSLNIDCQKQYHVNGYDSLQYGKSLYQTDDGGFAITGIVNNYISQLTSDICLIKVDSSFEVEWIQTYSFSDIDGANFINQTSDSGYVISGAMYNRGENYKYFIFKLK